MPQRRHPKGSLRAEPTTGETMSDAEAQAVVEMWLRSDTVIGEWHKDGGGDYWNVQDCETKVGPLAGPPVSLRVVRVRSEPSGEQTWIGEARRIGTHSSGEWLLILPVDNTTGKTQGWGSAEAAQAGVEAVLRNEHDPDSIRFPSIDQWDRE